MSLIFKRIQEIIPATIQGEGMHAGSFASFIRLYGCNVGCWFCDTGYAAPDHGKQVEHFDMDAEELRGKILANMVVITGGEPLTHPQIDPLKIWLRNQGKKICIETSGCVKNAPARNPFQHITLSPKEHCSKLKVNPEMWNLSNEVKLVISEENDFEYYEERIPRLLKSGTPVYLQPEFSSVPDVMEYIIDCLHDYPELKVSAQTHKFLGLR